ncbi:hypothetical protein C8R44DRAFT_764946, partial [Mycena epipterygia]
PHLQNSPPHQVFPKARSAPGGTPVPPGSARYRTAVRPPPPRQMIRSRCVWAMKRAREGEVGRERSEGRVDGGDFRGGGRDVLDRGGCGRFAFSLGRRRGRWVRGGLGERHADRFLEIALL